MANNMKSDEDDISLLFTFCIVSVAVNYLPRCDATHSCTGNVNFLRDFHVYVYVVT